MVTDTLQERGRGGGRALGLSVPPVLALLAVLAVLPTLLSLRLTLPVGPFYWDLFIYFDGANRVFDGQMPAADFFAPGGPLGYWLFAGTLALFPEGQPLLIAQWCLLAVTAPLMALVLVDVDKRSRTLAFALLVPFLVFSLLPVNVEEYYFYPGIDGFGIYNRHTSQLLYVLAAALVFVESRRRLLPVIAGAMLALFLVKITGFVAGGLLCALAFCAGRVDLRGALAVAAAFVLGLGLLQATTGVVLPYLADIAALVSMNTDSLLPRFIQASSIHFRVVGPIAVLVVALLWLDGRSMLRRLGGLRPADALATARDLADRDLVWLGATAFAALFFETQNTGGQGFIFVWPVLLRILVRANRFKGAAFVTVIALVAAASLPTFMQVAQRGARALVGQVNYVALPHQHLKTLGSVSQRPEVVERARKLMTAYAGFPETWRYFSAQKMLPSFTLYTEPDFQLTWLMAADEAAGAILAYEAQHGVRFETIMNINFVNPFPYLLDRHGTRLVAIGADPFRAVPDPDAAVLDAVRGTDLVLYPKCPVTDANDKLLSLYAPALIGHDRIALSRCWDAFVRPGLAAR
ncbi:hypothetical protein [Antarcticirhabdus aurantiaca]|uniref:Uncharacterized protein n=1 Tax=Antarcticirhabdus aurantiaca TaxID=2606717 RepID=A0ACD4NU36_9HYPH|nr:hypothetical protein [Antarcticirhabdus aurantiaca]WAJ30565.1 hypothetical protein OXU80_10310 [Jeongeuplla avenae]